MNSPAASAGSVSQPNTGIERITVALIPKAAGDLRRAVERTGLSKTDVVNRAVSLYEYLDSQQSSGAELLICGESGHKERIKFF